MRIHRDRHWTRIVRRVDRAAISGPMWPCERKYETSPLRMTKLFDAAKRYITIFFSFHSISLCEPTLPTGARAGGVSNAIFSAHEGECFDGQ